ncbi:D-alanyl-D-alanine carboxypeptidase/D-alanyl-D-alanine-endopeptidase [Rhodocytophaga rosea]|uniref:D-alanyl-D-alanine carboxypeptidase/D-alanyl-D-alanine-endopeptidase n=1 Tax=Rhodocytophaga rosea TaxID=2704465 RepID=A0A6C0GM52_9BACT|nr:D-alanyl-D-alanine carboxypeptidase/D-alanyl-D-alanine-endopeptidase [Rhodocytophaga rosea]QHT69116.1 D-alanyl-D-alanine carboxypeptidase/D-alanyl-D-alanine-endopeptidase [Rhodocytophaga rosea]
MRFPFQRLASYSCMAFVLICACAQTPENDTPSKPPVAVSLSDLQTAVQDLANDPAIKHGQVAFSLKSSKTGKVIYEFNGDKSVIIASNLKLVTTATALAVLGAGYTFKTELQYDGVLGTDGVLKGNIYILGGGDPVLGSDKVKGSLATGPLMEVWADKIKEAGITQVNGAVIGDGDMYNDNVTPGGWVWSDIGNYYGAPVYGLNINDNLYTLYFKPGAKIGDPARILRIVPPMQQLEIINEVTTGKAGSGDNAYIYGAPYTYLRQIQGTIPAGVNEFDIRGSLPDPVTFCAGLLQQKLTQKGIKVSQMAISTRLLRMRKTKINTDRKPIFAHLSPPLSAIVEETNLKSMNLYAEAMAKLLGVNIFKDGTTFSGTEAIVKFWKEKGIHTDGFFMRDGSGLSRTNVIRATTLTDILNWCAKDSIFAPLYNSLPVAGVSGTMKNIGKGTAAAGNIRAKTGTLERVMNYSGYYYNKSGELMSFAIITNDYVSESSAQIRKKIERIMVVMAGLS